MARRRWLSCGAAVFCLLMGPAIQASAEWRKDIGVFRVGIVAQGETAGTMARSEPFRLALTEALEMEVEFFPARTSNALIQALASERIEYAVLSASSYALAWAVCECVEPLVTPRSSDSTDGYHIVLISRPGGPQDIADMQNARLGFLTGNSITGYSLPLHLLGKQGEQTGIENMTAEIAKSPEESVRALAEGKLDILVGWSSMTGDPTSGFSRGTLKQVADMNGGDAKDFRVIWQSPQLPHHTHVVRKKIDKEAKLILRDTLSNMFERDPIAYDSIEPVYGGGFTVSTHGRFRTLIELVETLDDEANTEAEAKNPPE